MDKSLLIGVLPLVVIVLFTAMLVVGGIAPEVDRPGPLVVVCFGIAIVANALLLAFGKPRERNGQPPA